MKITIKYIAVCIGIIATMTACFKDKTTTYMMEHSTVQVFPERPESIFVTSGDTLILKADSVIETNSLGQKVLIDENNDRFEFKWAYGYSVNGPAFTDTISNEYVLKMKVTGNGYKGIVFIVTEKETGLEYYRNYSLQIGSSIGAGLLIADTEDGNTSRFHEIQNMYVSSSSDDEMKIVRDIYKNTTQADFNGLISHISYFRGYSGLENATLNVFTNDNGCFAYDGLFNKLGSNDDMFAIAPNTYKVKSIDRTFLNIFILNENGKVQKAENDGYLFSYPFITSDGSDYNASVFRAQPYYYNATYIYDEIENRFLMANPDESTLFQLQSTENIIDFNNVGAYDALYMNSGYSKGIGWFSDYYIITVLKSETGSDVYAYLFNADSQEHGGQKILDLSNCTDINNATGFASSHLEKILYYTVDNKVYSVSLEGSGAPVSSLAYEAPESGDKIGSIKIWIGASNRPTNMFITDITNPEGDPIKISAQNRMLLMSTYNESSQEGKVICVPIKILNSPTDGLESNVDNHRVFRGFGRILSMDHNSPVLR